MHDSIKTIIWLNLFQNGFHKIIIRRQNIIHGSNTKINNNYIFAKHNRIF